MNADVIVVGGGLTGGLLALRLALAHPEMRILLLEREATLGGNHTWQYAELGDPPEWMAKMISRSWSEQEVRFPSMERVLPIRHCCIRSADFHKYVVEKLGSDVRLGCDVRKISDCEVVTSKGEILRAPLVIDTSGIHPTLISSSKFLETPCAWVKYIGFDFKVTDSHGVQTPMAMDSRVPQMEGFRYFSYLPWDEKRIYVQESFLSSTPDLNYARISRSIRSYVNRAGWDIASVEREEMVAIPLPLFGFPIDNEDASKVQTEGEDFSNQSPVYLSSSQGWFHSTTGQAVSDAVRVADFVAALPRLRTGPVRAELRHFRRDWVEQQRFYRLINRLVFRATEPSLRHVFFDRFFRLKEDVVARFLTGTSTKADATKILAVKPPIRNGRIFKNWQLEAAP